MYHSYNLFILSVCYFVAKTRLFCAFVFLFIMSFCVLLLDFLEQCNWTVNTKTAFWLDLNQSTTQKKDFKIQYEMELIEFGRIF